MLETSSPPIRMRLTPLRSNRVLVILALALACWSPILAAAVLL